MKYKSILFDEARNKIGGIVASANKDGNYFREKVTPHNPRSAAQTAVRANFTTNSQAWKRLTDTQRQGWIALAKQVTHTDTLGNKYQPSGQQLYVGCNGNLTNIGGSAISDAPGTPDTVATPSGMLVVATVETAAPQTQVLTLEYDGVPGGSFQGISTTALYSAGRSFVGKSQLRFTAINNWVSSLPFSILTDYQTVHGNLAIGAKLTVEVRSVSINGFASAPARMDVVVAAA